ncbi:MAG: HAMP domain-containing protein [Alphaproteobacteria bacterium]|nr:HAMP domain-containing protein [Alphaproteobacteria bacterium]
MAFARTQAIGGARLPFDLSRLKLKLSLPALWAKLRVHHVLFVAFTAVAAVPVLSLAAWVEHRAVQQQIDLATDKHLLVAHNLTSAFSRYVFDVKAGFRLGIATFYSGEPAPGLRELLSSLEFRHICILNGDTGAVERFMPGFAETPNAPIVLKPETLSEFRRLLSQVHNDDIVITDLRRDTAGRPAFFLLKALPDGRIAYGVFGTNYLVALQHKIAFGARGHAVVVDAVGKTVAHPTQSWVDSELDMSKIPPVKAIMAGQSGVMQFYSPAFKADMITAYTSVPETKWGVMVPQPMEELYAQADEVGRVAATMAFLGLVAAGVISWGLAKYVMRPLKAVSDTAAAIADGDPAARAPSFAIYIPAELHLLSGSFNHMLDELRQRNHDLAETAVRAEAANRAKSEFLTNMSHELRTPLNAIQGFSEIMRDQVFGPMTNKQYLGYASDINNSAQHLLRVITDILDLSKAEAGRMTVEQESFELKSAFSSATRIVEQAAIDKSLVLSQKVAPELHHAIFRTDEGKLVQILVNLLANSVKFTEPGGHVTLSAQYVRDRIEIAIIDTGIGIAAGDIQNVMTPFGQVASAYHAHEGFGLGLPLSKKLAEALGADFRLESELGRGTIVTLCFPADLHLEMAQSIAA